MQAIKSTYFPNKAKNNAPSKNNSNMFSDASAKNFPGLRKKSKIFKIHLTENNAKASETNKNFFEGFFL